MPSFPDFANATVFPTFSSLPLATDNASEQLPHYTLIATIGENMTVSTSPTFICKDPSDTPFALTLRLPASSIKEGVRGGGYDVKGFKKGFSVVVPGARRSGVKDGKQGFVEIPVQSVKIIPASVKKLVEIGEKERELEKRAAIGEGKQSCQACGAEKKADNLSRCRGCGGVWYCDKECQTKAWNEKGHKTECKVFRGVKAAFPEGG